MRVFLALLLVSTTCSFAPAPLLKRAESTCRARAGSAPRSPRRGAASEGNSDSNSLAQVRALQRAFYKGEEGCKVLPSGIILDLPLWRVQWVELPGFQNVLNVWQPHYTHMFEAVVAAPKNNWYFGHLHLPGGTESLGKEGSGLDWRKASAMEPSGLRTHAPVVGTLMQVREVARLEDGRLRLVVQAVERFAVLRAKREAPYTVADVQLLPDREACAPHLARAEVALADAAAGRAATATAAGEAGGDGAPQVEKGAQEGGREWATWAAARAAASAEALEVWRGFELGPVEVSQVLQAGGEVSPLAPFHSPAFPAAHARDGPVSRAIGASAASPALQEGWAEMGRLSGGAEGDDLLRDELRLSPGGGPGDGLSRELVEAGLLLLRGRGGEGDEVVVGSRDLDSVLRNADAAAARRKTDELSESQSKAPDSAPGADAGARAPKAGGSEGGASKGEAWEVADLEFHLWCELDATIRLLQELNPTVGERVPLPTQLLGLLPSAPPEGRSWPLGFYFHTQVARMAQAQSTVGTYTKSPFVAVGFPPPEGPGNGSESPSALEAGAASDDGGAIFPPNELLGGVAPGRGPTAPPMYPASRRAWRLSYAASVLVDGLAGLTGGRTDAQGLAAARQELLAHASTKGRLDTALGRFKKVNHVLRSFVNEKDRGL